MISVIEERRKRAGITQKALCERAKVDKTTYSQIKRGHRGGYQRTFEKLSTALDAVEQERAVAQ